jgi:hypothetical protein
VVADEADAAAAGGAHADVFGETLPLFECKMIR